MAITPKSARYVPAVPSDCKNYGFAIYKCENAGCGATIRVDETTLSTTHDYDKDNDGIGDYYLDGTDTDSVSEALINLAYHKAYEIVARDAYLTSK